MFFDSTTLPSLKYFITSPGLHHDPPVMNHKHALLTPLFGFYFQIYVQFHS